MSVLRLDGVWKFCFRKDDNCLPEDYNMLMPVPGCFDVTPDLFGKRGVGYYIKDIVLDFNKLYRLEIGGVAHNAKVYLNRKEIASHHGAFTAIIVDLPSGLSGKNELVISADNRFDGLDRPLHMSHFDWYSYGGIIRPVNLIEYDKAIIKRILPVILDYKIGRVSVEIDYKSKQELPIEIYVDEMSVFTSTVKSGEKILNADIQIDNPELWSPANPKIYSLKVKIGDFEKTINLGLRKIETHENRILLNGENFRIKGINRHESHVQLGFTLPEQLHLTDLQLIKNLGCNFVRISHYPPSHEFLDLCDRLGLAVWCEATSWGYDENMTTDSRTLAAQRQCITEMITQYAHHPSIVCWGFFNECASFAKSARPVYEELTALIRKLDPNRPVTYATMYSHIGSTVEKATIDDIMFDLVDWISINIYPGWYGGDLDNCVVWMDNLIKNLDAQDLSKKPIIISEIGAGGIAGFEHYYPIKWSLSYQSQLMEKLIDYIRTQPLLNGVCVWQFCDIRTSEYRFADRPRNYNNKGLVDEYRRPKPVYNEIKKIYGLDW